ncbi:hypothetical protein E0L36_20805 [Streptomyces sp. AJS327]|uniref:hypothetical protein n=1 Tax=Streptomyces sp. AJS327 TaxID=2545265 RepID=UPI0015E04AAB|nr:hypothetical protein [Streptomyces sp. AJS327]MBA0053224.1 hypothetical protein [Streptomyces sp. AJS327]
MTTPTTGLMLFAHARRVRLTTYEPEGTPVGCRAHITVEGDRAFVRTYGHARTNLDRYPEVEIVTASAGGTPTGAPMKARVRKLSGEESRHAAGALARKHPLMQGLVTPLTAALRMDRPSLYELRLVGE